MLRIWSRSTACVCVLGIASACSSEGSGDSLQGFGSSGAGAATTGGGGGNQAGGQGGMVPGVAGTSGTSGSSAGGALGSSGAPPSGGGGTPGVSGSGGSNPGGASGNGGATAGSGGRGESVGETAYRASCEACHGALGAGSALGPEVQHPVRDYGAWVVRHGREGAGFMAPMPPLEPGKLSDDTLKAIFDYLDTPPQPTTPEGLYLDYCANCHGKTAKGGPTTRNILMKVNDIPKRVRQGAHVTELGNRKEYMPAFPASRLSDDEIDEIKGYVDSL